MLKKEDILAVVQEYAEANGLFVVEVKVSAANDIQVVVDSMEGVSIDRCAELSRFVESRFDRDTEDYELTVSSASISEPFRMVQQYRKHQGREVEVWLEGERTKSTGVLGDVTDEGFSLTGMEKVEVEGKKRKELREVRREIPFSRVREAKLVIKF